MSSCLQSQATKPACGCLAYLPTLPQVAEIHRTSKDGQLYHPAGGAKGCSAQAKPPEPTEHDILPASQVYSVSGPGDAGDGTTSLSSATAQPRLPGQPRPLTALPMTALPPLDSPASPDGPAPLDSPAPDSPASPDSPAP